MPSLVAAALINDAFGDPGLYIDFRFARRALLFDLGETQAVSQRKLLRVSHAFVSHTHLDHFNGFDRLLRACLGRPMSLRLVGPPGFIDRVDHKLHAYTWNLIAQNTVDFIIAAAEFDSVQLREASEFHSRDAFQRRDVSPPNLPAGVVLDEPDFQIRSTALDHGGIPSLAFALVEKLGVNVWKARLDDMGLVTGPWLARAKQAVRRGEADETPLTALGRVNGGWREVEVLLGDLKKSALQIGPGEISAYVVDTSFNDENTARIVELARNADRLFIETVFLDEDKKIAARKHHLTAQQAGRIAREAGAKQLVPFHFSPRYQEREDQLRQEAANAFLGIGGRNPG